MHLWHSLLISTCWWWEVTSARGREKKVLKEQLLFWRKKRPRLCISKLRSNEFYSAESWRIGIERFGGTHLKFSGCNWYKIEFGKGKGQPGGSIQKGEPRGQNPCAPGFEEWTLEEIARQADCDSKVAWNLERKKAQCCAREILSSDRIETLREGPKTVSRYWPRLGKSANNRGRTSFVRDFDLFVTVRLLDETPAVLLLHILCSKHRYPFEWKIGETPRLATNWKSIARTFIWKSEPRFGRWCFKSGDSKNGSTVLTLTSANTERDLFPEQKRLVTWKQHRGTRSHYFSGYYPCETKTSQETEKNLWNIFRAVTEAKSYFYERLVEVWQVLWRIIMESSDKLLPIDQRQQIAERAVRRVKEGTSAVLLQSGLIWEWWPDSMKCFFYLQKVQNYLANGKSQIWTKIWGIILRTNYTFDALIGHLPELREK